ncbi:hypothetical protein J2Z49_002322 [Desulfofundulus luciae]|uniref:Uncharacterized protein n=1 Tax=Desulfofundulus luciae TaxID=74702 RepID=A0ABU0B3A7_9FIRM|nr:hypothetical protein [Desulfofundulus luciae]MDQ0287201.1 hypothetical protein [Desulfofundulus luciae]
MKMVAGNVWDYNGPLIWPATVPRLTECNYSPHAPWISDFIVDRFLGVTYDLDDRGINWIAGLLGKEEFKCRLVLLLYPACATRKEHLEHMLWWQDSYGGRFEARLLPVNTRPLTVLALLHKNRWVMAVGAAPNLGADGTYPGLLNLFFLPDGILLENWRRWFELLWHASVPLTVESAAIPPLVPAKGSEEAARLWAEYVQACYGLLNEEGKDVQLEEAVVREESRPAMAQSDRVEFSVTAEMGIPRLDPLAEKIDRIFQKGKLVSIDKYSRIPPLEIPIRPEWFGIESFRRVGSVTRRVSYKVSVFRDKEIRIIDNKKKAAQNLLRRFSFSLADGQWLIPVDAIRLFEEELERINSEGIEQVKKIVGDKIEEFIEARKEEIFDDVEDMYREFYPQGSLPQHAKREILKARGERLQKLGGQRLLPQVAYAEVRFSPESDSKWTSPWAQALRLLKDIAEYPRKFVTDPYFARGLRVNGDDLLRAMNVCNDMCVKLWFEHGTKVEERARNELNILQQIIQQEDTDQRAKCAAILALIEGEEPPTFPNS